MDVIATYEEAQKMIAADARLEEALERVAGLDFSMLKRKLIEESGWTTEDADATEALYRCFLALNARYWGRKICPNGPIDAFWHAHILDTSAYEQDCEAVFGELLHHYPYFGMHGPNDAEALQKAFQESVALYIVHFGIDITAGDGAGRSCASQRCP